MSRSLPGVLRAAALAALAFATLRPTPRLEQALDLVLSPVRILGELARPVGWLDRRAVRAAEHSLAEVSTRERAGAQELARSLRHFALPSSSELTAGRTFAHGTVLSRSEDDLDEVHVRVAGGTDGIERGLPVVAGDVFVGRVRAVDDPRPGQVTVELVTGRSFNVGARIAPPSDSQDPGDRGDAPVREPRRARDPVRFVAGGLVATDRRRADDPRLAVRAPSSREPEDLVGEAFVDESLSPLEPWGRLANGFRLGRLSLAGGRRGIVPELDYEDGLSQVAIVLPAERVRHAAEEPDAFGDGAWLASHRLSFGDPAGARAGLVLSAGRLRGARSGAAVVSGTRLVGRVQRASALSSSVRTLADPGLSVPAVARLAGGERPLALGLLVSEGRDPESGELVLRWSARVPLPRAAAAELRTASGQSGVPAGLWIGRADLPAGPGPHRLFVRDTAPFARVRRLWVRRDAEVEP